MDAFISLLHFSMGKGKILHKCTTLEISTGSAFYHESLQFVGHYSCLVQVILHRNKSITRTIQPKIL
jgi:hypothetical protein